MPEGIIQVYLRIILFATTVSNLIVLKWVGGFKCKCATRKCDVNMQPETKCLKFEMSIEMSF
jgi:hypothetical protein